MRPVDTFCVMELSKTRGIRKTPFHLQGQTLHAKVLGFLHPTTGNYIEVDAPLPDYFLHLLHIL